MTVAVGRHQACWAGREARKSECVSSVTQRGGCQVNRQTAATQRSHLLCLGCQLWVSSHSRLTSHCLNTDATHTLHLLRKNNTYYQTNTHVKVPCYCYCQIFSFHLGPRRRHLVTTQHTGSQATKHQQTKQPDWVRCRLALCDLTKRSHSMWLFHSMGSLT